MPILFARPSHPQDDDDGFESELFAIDQLELEAHVLPFEPLVLDEPWRALEDLPEPAGRRYVLRSWILTAEEYEALDDAMTERGDFLYSSPEEYRAALHLPEWAPALGAHTPASIWTEGEDAEEAYALALEELGPPPWILKDWVKSAKEHWADACFVPEGSTKAEFLATADRLHTLRGARFEGGFVVRRFEALRPTTHRTPERTIPEEHRVIFVEGEAVALAPYHDLELDPLRPEEVAFIGERIDAPFFCADIARRIDGGLCVIEINPGEVSSWPPQLDPRDVYGALAGDR